MLVLGAGRMGLGAVFDLARQPDVEQVTVADAVLDRAQHVAALSPKVKAVQLDVSDDDAVVALMRGHASAISCVNYWYNEKLARAAIAAGTNFCDLGGNNALVDAELALDAEAKGRGVNVIPDCGLAPGTENEHLHSRPRAAKNFGSRSTFADICSRFRSASASCR